MITSIIRVPTVKNVHCNIKIMVSRLSVNNNNIIFSRGSLKVDFFFDNIDSNEYGATFRPKQNTDIYPRQLFSLLCKHTGLCLPFFNQYALHEKGISSLLR